MALNDNNLGKSLTNVFARTQKKKPEASRLVDVDINLVIPPKANPRKTMTDEGLEELAASIRKHGILQPIVALKRDGGYEVLAGERRYRAARLAGLAKVPVVVHEASGDQQIAELRLIENIQREDLNAIELAQAYQALIDDYGLTQEQVAERVGKDRSSVANGLRLLTLPRAIQRMVAENSIQMGHARAVASLEDPAQAEAICRRVIAEGLSVRVTERLAREAAAGEEGEAKPKRGRRKPAHLRELEGNLGRLFGTQVDIRERGGKGTVTVHFHSKGHFKQVIDTLDQVFQASRKASPDSED